MKRWGAVLLVVVAGTSCARKKGGRRAGANPPPPDAAAAATPQALPAPKIELVALANAMPTALAADGGDVLWAQIDTLDKTGTIIKQSTIWRVRAGSKDKEQIVKLDRASHA